MRCLRFVFRASLPAISLITICSGAVLFLAALVPADAVAQVTNWPEDRFGNDRLGFNPYEAILNPSNVNKLGLLWRRQQASNLIIVSPAVANGILYADSFTIGRG